MNHYFVDTSFIIALEIVNEQHHKIARSFWLNLSKKNTQLITTSYIFDETVTFFNSRQLHSKAVEIGQSLLYSRLIDFIHVDQVLFEQAWLVFQKYNDKSYSLTDCISFVVMQQRQITQVLTFDRHFAQAGFLKLP